MVIKNKNDFYNTAVEFYDKLYEPIQLIKKLHIVRKEIA